MDAHARVPCVFACSRPPRPERPRGWLRCGRAAGAAAVGCGDAPVLPPHVPHAEPACGASGGSHNLPTPHARVPLCCHPMYCMLSLRAVPQVGHTTRQLLTHVCHCAAALCSVCSALGRCPRRGRPPTTFCTPHFSGPSLQAPATCSAHEILSCV